MIDIAEEEPKVDPETTERDGYVPPLPASTMGICAMECIRYKSVQGRRSLNAEAFEAGYNEGYGDGYVDGYDDGQYNQLVGLIREFEEEGFFLSAQLLRRRLEHDEKEA